MDAKQKNHYLAQLIDHPGRDVLMEYAEQEEKSSFELYMWANPEQEAEMNKVQYTWHDVNKRYIKFLRSLRLKPQSALKNLKINERSTTKGG